MSKKKFSILERFVIWKYHDKKCYICEEPINFRETTIDHVIPESCLINEDKYNEFKNSFGLNDNFNINGFENWMPCHSICNSQKACRLLPITNIALKTAAKKATIIQKELEKLEEDESKNEILATLLGWIENDKISPTELSLAFEMFNFSYVMNIDRINRDELSYVPQGWHATGHSTRKGMIFVENGTLGGYVPATSNDAADEWICPRCHAYGPWNGAKCLNCGALSTDCFE